MADVEEFLSQEEMVMIHYQVWSGLRNFVLQEAIGLELEQVKVLKGCFDGFADEDGAIPADNVGGILSMMGMKVKPSALKEIIEEIDEDGEILLLSESCEMFYSLKDPDCLSLESFASLLLNFLLKKTMKH